MAYYRKEVDAEGNEKLVEVDELEIVKSHPEYKSVKQEAIERRLAAKPAKTVEQGENEVTPPVVTPPAPAAPVTAPAPALDEEALFAKFAAKLKSEREAETQKATVLDDLIVKNGLPLAAKDLLALSSDPAKAATELARLRMSFGTGAGEVGAKREDDVVKGMMTKVFGDNSEGK